MSSKSDIQAKLNLYLTEGSKAGKRDGTIQTIDMLISWIGTGGIVDAKYLVCLKAAMRKKYFEEDYGDYKSYIQSDDWKDKATKAKENAGWRCQLCNKEGNRSTLHAHHRTYERIGVERDGDIIVLCAECHAKFHGKD